MDLKNYYGEMLRSFLECFPTYQLHSKPQSEDDELWVFSNEDEGGSQNNSYLFSDDVGTRTRILSAFSKVRAETLYFHGGILQLWAPVTIGGRLVLSTYRQPFAVTCLHEDLLKYRGRCVEFGYNLPEMLTFNTRVNQEAGPLLDYGYEECKFQSSWMMPLFDPSQSSSSDCIGAVECSLLWKCHPILIERMNEALEKVGLRAFNAQDHIPYKTISGLKPTKEQIQKELVTVCEPHAICLAQVWISYEDDNHEHFSSSLMSTQMKQRLALKLTGYISSEEQLFDYYDACDMIPLKEGDELVLKTFQDYEPRFYTVAGFSDEDTKCSGLTIRMRSIDTSDFDYAFEFIWYHDSNYVMFLEALLLTLKRCLPRFKCASGAELGDELYVIDFDNSTKSETKTFRIFQENGLLPTPEEMEKGKKAMVLDHRANTEVKCKTAEIALPLERIEQQFGKNMKEAAKNLKVSLSTLKRKLKNYGITKWKGPDDKSRKRKVDDSFNNQNCTNEKDYGAIQDPLSINRDEDTLTIKAEYADDTIKFDLPLSEATFDTVKKEICTRLDLTFGTYKLKYRDEVGDWISLLSGKDMIYHMNYLRKVNKKEVRLRVCLHNK